MATILFAAAGAAVGGAVGGTALGLSSAVIGRAVGATLGRVIDQRVMGSGSEVIEGPRLSRYRVTGASEGAPLGRVFGRTRVAGQVIWSTRFREKVKKRERSAGGKGGGASVTTKSYSYSVSLAVALGEGEITRVGRVWADGVELGSEVEAMRVYSGSESQQPDPLIEAVEGVGNVPAYRGLAYVVFEDLQLAEFGNRVPNLSFEVIRPTDPDRVAEGDRSVGTQVQGVALMPGSGEYALATTPVYKRSGYGRSQAVNMNVPGGQTDFATSLNQLREEVPGCGAVSLIVSWFGDDLRCGDCRLLPKVEPGTEEGTNMPWRAGGLTRADAEAVASDDGRAVYGGTPSDQSVVEAIVALKAAGQHVTFYPFILMEQMPGNVLPDPWTGGSGQPHLPWRGRITTSLAPGVPGSPDGTAAAADEVAAFFGTCGPQDFAPGAGGVDYTGPDEASYRRFILHYAHLCAQAGGVDAFCIGSEMRALTQIRGAAGTFPAVSAMIDLARDVRAILGDGVRIGYAADWSEYFGYHPQDGSGDVRFHLDPLWADPDIDFIGIDNYMPLSDWRGGTDHLDAQAGWGSIYDVAYLRANVAGGEGFDWYYPDATARELQARIPITDGAYGEPWVFRYKDLRSWWENPHHDRIDGARQPAATPWVPRSKPIWFTEFGCAAVDKATNQPNKFVDPKSSESRLPYFSDGRRDELIQAQYLRAMIQHFAEPANNPVSPLYGGAMVDMSRAHVWAWDARPWPAFPERTDLWTDAANYYLGHWLNGRASHESLSAVVTDICVGAGLSAPDVSRVHGLVRGYDVETGQGARSALQPLMLGYGMEAAEREGTLRFSMRQAGTVTHVDPDRLVESPEVPGDVERIRGPVSEVPDRVQVTTVASGGAFDAQVSEAVFPGTDVRTTLKSELPLSMTPGEARSVAERWLAESRIARDGARFALPPSALSLGAGDVVRLSGAGGDGLYRIDRVELGEGQLIEAVRVENGVYETGSDDEPVAPYATYASPALVDPFFLDLPMMSGEEVPHAPHVAIAADPWPGPVAVYASVTDAGYDLDTLVEAPAAVGVTLDPLAAAAPGRWDRGAPVRVRLDTGGPLSTAEMEALLAGANALAIGTGAPDGWEVLQFREAQVVGPDTYELRDRLRGQLGTDGDMPAEWPAGSVVVVLDGSLSQIALPASARGLSRHYRVGAADVPLDDPTVAHLEVAFDGIGLRPYAPVHLRGREGPDGGLHLSWIRRTRIDGDSWIGGDVPLGEEAEGYSVRVCTADGTTLREAQVAVPAWTYGAAERAADGGTAAYAEVAQLSTRFGAGAWRRIEIDG